MSVDRRSATGCGIYLAAPLFAASDILFFVYTGFGGIFFSLLVGAAAIYALSSAWPWLLKGAIWSGLAIIYCITLTGLIAPFFVFDLYPDFWSAWFAPLSEALQFKGLTGTRLAVYLLASAVVVLFVWLGGRRLKSAANEAGQPPE